MKKLPFRVEYLVLGAVIVVLVLAITLRGPNRLRYRLPEPDALRTESITRITTSGPTGGLDLVLRDGVWRIEPQGHKADAATVSPMVEALAGLELTTLVSESGAWTRYGLDEGERLVITAWQGDREARVVEVGKEDDAGRTSFVLLPGDRRVYTTRQNFRNLFDVTPEKLRDMTVLTMTRADVTTITVRSGDRTIGLTRSGEEWKSQDGELWDTEVVERLLRAVTPLRAQRYGAEGQDLGAVDTVATLATADGATHTLTIHVKEGTQYPAVSTQSEDPFYVAEYQRNDVVSVLEGRKTE